MRLGSAREPCLGVVSIFVFSSVLRGVFCIGPGFIYVSDTMLISAPNFLLSKQTLTTPWQNVLLSVIMALVLVLSQTEDCEMFIRFSLEDQGYNLRACFGNKAHEFSAVHHS
jgi:hypothetical protein